MSWRVTTAHTRARSASTVQCVTSASSGATTWLNMPGDTQASIPACFRAPVQPRDAATPCPCPRLTLETKALLGCETNTLLYIQYTHKGTCNRYRDKHRHTHMCGACSTQILSNQSTQPARPIFKTFFYACTVAQQQTETSVWTWLIKPELPPLIPWGGWYLLSVIQGLSRSF